MAITAEQWKSIESDLSVPYGRVRLRADGTVLTIAVERGKGLRYVIAVYIDGIIKWKLCNDKQAEAPRKFWKLEKRYLYPAAKRAEFEKLAKKRGMPADLRGRYGRMATDCIEMYSPCWPSAKPLCRQLRKTCTELELLPRYDDEPIAAVGDAA